MVHHKLRFGLRKNIKVLICWIMGHRINNNPAHHWCERCGLAYEEAYHGIGQGYWMESGVINKSLYDNQGRYKRSIEIDEEEEVLNQKVFEFLIEHGNDEIIAALRRHGKKLADAIADPDILI